MYCNVPFMRPNDSRDIEPQPNPLFAWWQMGQEEEQKRFDAYLDAHAEEARATFMRTVRASYEENGKEAQKMCDVRAPEAAEQAEDENPSNAC